MYLVTVRIFVTCAIEEKQNELLTPARNQLQLHLLCGITCF